jgi:hypothetical protein
VGGGGPGAASGSGPVLLPAMPRARTGVGVRPGGIRPPACSGSAFTARTEDAPSELIEAAPHAEAAAFEAAMSSNPLPPWSERQGSPGSPGPSGRRVPLLGRRDGPQSRRRRPAARSAGLRGRLRRSPSAAAGWPTRAASRLGSRTASTRRDRRREQAAAHSRSATRAQQMESSVETSAAVADERGPVRAAPWRRATPSTDAAASPCRVLEDQSDHEDRESTPESDRAAR